MAEADNEELFSLKSQYLTSINLNVFINNIINNKKRHVSWKFYSSQQKPGDYSLHPQWITGFTDAEGSFGLKIFKSEGYKFGWRYQPFFQIKLNHRDLEILRRIQAYFGGAGKISFEKNSAKYTVTTVNELMLVVIPFFEKYPLLTQKFADFELFRKIILIMFDKGHLTEQGFLNILNLRYNLNRGISEELKILFPNLIPVERPFVPEREISPDWLVGFVDGEGSFNVNMQEEITSSLTTPISRKVWLYFQITQHSRDFLLLEKIVKYLGCGTVNNRNTPIFDNSDYKLSNFDMIDSKILPFFQKYPLQSAKLLDFQCFADVANIIKSKPGISWTPEQFDQIKHIKNIMNKYTKESLVESNDNKE